MIRIYRSIASLVCMVAVATSFAAVSIIGTWHGRIDLTGVIKPPGEKWPPPAASVRITLVINANHTFTTSSVGKGPVYSRAVTSKGTWRQSGSFYIAKMRSYDEKLTPSRDGKTLIGTVLNNKNGVRVIFKR